MKSCDCESHYLVKIGECGPQGLYPSSLLIRCSANRKWLQPLLVLSNLIFLDPEKTPAEIVPIFSKDSKSKSQLLTRGDVTQEAVGRYEPPAASGSLHGVVTQQNNEYHPGQACQRFVLRKWVVEYQWLPLSMLQIRSG